MVTASPFQPFASNGLLPDLLAIVPPGGALSPYSNLTSDNYGKTPGLPTVDGWEGHTAWTSFTTTKQHLARWSKQIGGGPCNVGLNARTLHAFDIDTNDQAFARACYDLLRKIAPHVLREAGLRIGRPPGWLTVFRPETPHKKTRVLFVHRESGAKSAVELLGVGQQYVISGQHPSGKPYEWRRVDGGTILAQRRLDQFTVTLDGIVDNYLDQLPAALQSLPYDLHKPAKARLASGGDGEGAGPESLLAPDLDTLAAALESLPNRTTDNRDYDEWIAFLHAIAGATGKSAEGRSMWLMWSAQWDDTASGNAAAERRWDTLDPAHIGIGWEWLREKASAANPAFRQLTAQSDFAGAEHVNGVAILDGGLFAKPASDADEIEAAIASLEPGDIAAINRLTKLIARSGVSDAGRELFIQDIARKTRINKTALRRQISNDIRNLRRDDPDVQIRLALLALNHFGKGKLAHYKNAWWLFTGKHWARQADDGFIHRVMLEAVMRDDRLLLSTSGQNHHSGSMIKAAIPNLAAMCNQVLAPLDDPRFAVRDVINLRNGTLWLHANGQHELKPHDPADCFLGLLDIDYDPLALGTLYDRTLRDMLSRTYFILRADDDRALWEAVKERVDRAGASEQEPLTLPDGRLAWRTGNSYRVCDLAENCRLINEILGYALIPSRFARQFAVFKGNGINGKSELVRLISQRMPSMVLATSIDSLDTRFVLSQLQGKTLLTIDEGADSETPSARIKELTENHAFTVDVKGKDFAEVMLTVFPILNTNSHFFTRDATEGMRSRIIIVPFNKRYNENDREANPWPQIAASEDEMSAMLNRLIDGLTDVIARRYIKRTRATDQAIDLWTARNTPQAAFAIEYLTTKRPQDVKSDGDKLSIMHPAWVEWCRVNMGPGYKAAGPILLAEKLEQLGYEKYQSDGMTRFRGLWVNPAKVSMAGFINSDFTPLTAEPQDDAT